MAAPGYHLEDLWTKINRGLEKHGPSGNGHFFPNPESTLREVVTKVAIENTLQEIHTQLGGLEVRVLTNFVFDYAYVIYAILIMMRAPWLITTFYHHRDEFKQEYLPIKYTVGDDNTLDFVSQGGERGQIVNDMLRLTDPKWGEDFIERFCTIWQWKFTAPTFKRNKFRYTFTAETILPFTATHQPLDPESKEVPVQKATIHRAHIQLPDDIVVPPYPKNPIVAIKTVSHGDGVEQEAGNLEKVRELQHKHLIQGIASYPFGGNHFFLFPLAEKQTLWHFWAARTEEIEKKKKKNVPYESHRGDNRFLVWVFTQLVGLADALVQLHDPRTNIRHGDLKPKNILCFEARDDNGTQKASGLPPPSIRLVITDVGISRSHVDETEQREITQTTVSTIRYEPPEMAETKRHKQEGHTKLSRRYDVWSMGCILLEFLIWLLYDMDGLLEFTDTGRFYQLEGKRMRDARLSDNTRKWISKIKKNENCNTVGTPLERLIYLIEHKLLVIKVLTLPKTLTSASREETPSPRIFSVLRNTLRKQTADFAKAVESKLGGRVSAEEMREDLQKILAEISKGEFQIRRSRNS